MIDLEGFAGRIVPLPVEAGNLTDLAAGTDGQIYYIRRPAIIPNKGRPARKAVV